MTRSRFAQQALGRPLHDTIKDSRVLVVGAGGIGCELLKNLVLTGFGNIHIVDLDTIDLSNLNRQFLFRSEHIKMPKAVVAESSAKRFNPNVDIEGHHADIKNPRFNVDWFKRFAIVFNALDNLDARRHVNMMCLAAEVPLIESGTTGFNGQVQVISKDKAECYDCNVKETPKSFPVCTIRSTPSQPIHCIVWAKSYLFTEIFGTSDDDSPDLDHTEDSENGEEIENLRREAQALKSIRESMASEEFPRLVFEKVFDADIERLLSMEEMWAHRRAPKPLHWESFSKENDHGEETCKRDQGVWTLAENVAVFKLSIRRLAEQCLDDGRNGSATGALPLSFDKDEVDMLNFVAAAANLRSHIFGIKGKSRFEIKQMAGNIIPAIATTNAMTAGLCVLQAFKVMNNDFEKAKMVFLTRSTDRVLTAESLHPPKPDCPVCSVAQAELIVDTSCATVQRLVDLLGLKFSYGVDITIICGEMLIYDPEEKDKLPMTFRDVGLNAGGFVRIIDDEDNSPRVDLVLRITENTTPDSEDIRFAGSVNIPRKAKPPPVDVAQTVGNGAVTNGTSNKRKRTADTAEIGGVEDDEPKRKRGKAAEKPISHLKYGGPDEIIVIDDSAPITIDD